MHRVTLPCFSLPNCWSHLPILAPQELTMPNKALSEHVKKQKQTHIKEETLQKASTTRLWKLGKWSVRS
jgi:hypothetical protein